MTKLIHRAPHPRHLTAWWVQGRHSSWIPQFHPGQHDRSCLEILLRMRVTVRKPPPPNPMFLCSVQNHAKLTTHSDLFTFADHRCIAQETMVASHFLDCVSTACGTYQWPQKNPLEWHLQLESQNHIGTKEKQQCSFRLLLVNKL